MSSGPSAEPPAGRSGGTPLIELRGVHRTYSVGGSQVRALDGVDLTVRAGEYLSIMGPSGSGKSTLLHVIGLLDRPDTGQYLLDGRNTGTLPDREQAALRLRRIGFVFQFFHLIPRLTAAENVALPLELAGVDPAEAAERVRRTLADLGMDTRAGHRPDQLSGGQRQRVAIARATIMQPGILLADEPTGNLDRHSGDEVVELLEALNARGIALLVVTHDPEIGGRARRRIRVDDGRVADDDGGGA